jgi:heme-degrading monooxygenase HmoA
MPRTISMLAVAPEADDDLLAAWQGAPGTTLYRALRPDAEFRFVAVAEGDVAPALPVAAHGGVYEVVHEDGTPDGDEGVTLVNPFVVPTDADEPFLVGWGRARDLLAGQQGYLGTRLHRSDAATFRFVNVARWSSPLMFSRALQRREFQEVAGAMAFASHPSLYLVVRGA